MVTGRTLWFEGPRRVVIKPHELAPTEDGEVLVRTAFSGISAGTEMLAYRGELDPELPIDETIGALGGTFRYPFRYGYSCVGVVEQSRSALAEGELVFAFQPHQDMFIARAVDVVALGAIDARNATLFPLVETALQITLDAGPLLGETVVVLGLGVVGALSALMLRRAGARVVAVEPRAWRRDAMAGLGVEVVAPDSLERALSADGRSPVVPMVIEASGNPDALRSAFGLLAHEGTVLVASWYGNKEVALPLGKEFHRRRLTIRSTQVSSIPAILANRWDRASRTRAVVALLTELPLDRLASHTFAVEDAGDAYAAIDEGSEGLMHAALGYR
jgi:2-desacetyl-2-hydroxyethyl bacteriochlorophyllide A dehydrogenase